MKKIILFFSWTGAFGIGVGWVSSVVWAQGAIDPKEKVAELPSIIKYSSDSPVDLLNDDPILPVVSGATHSTAGSGSIQRSISNRVPLPYYETGAPGNIAQFRGLGRSVEDTSVQALGVPLNYPQGGGFDLSIFPQFLWAGFQFQSGPSLGAFDPRAISGTVSLLPWTVDALRGETEWQRKFWVMGSSAGLQQTALGMARPGSWAAMLGMSLGKSVGPSGSFSIAFGDPKRLSGRFHLLATHLEVQNPGAQSFPTPNARSLTIRMIPVAQVDYRFSEETLYKGSVFIDGSYLRSNDPDSQLYSRDHAYQVGTENVLLHGNWRLGLNLRHLTYHTTSEFFGSVSDFESPAETIFGLQAGRLLELDSLSVEPTLRGIWASAVGILPEGSLGIKYWLIRRELALFSRTSWSRRLPSLADRYYRVSYFVGNPDLAPEKDGTQSLGIALSLKRVKFETQLLSQRRWDAQTRIQLSPFLSTMENLGTATVVSAMSDLEIHWADGFRSRLAGTWTYSHLDASGLEFPYLPPLTGLTELVLSPGGAEGTVEVLGLWRVASSALASSRGDRVAGYGYVDLSLRWRFRPEWTLVAGVENLLDRRFELIQDFPVVGRVFSASVQAVF